MRKRIRYRRGSRSIRVSVDAPDDHTCAGCHEEFTGRRLNTHHWKEVHTLDQVRLDPQLALENSRGGHRGDSHPVPDEQDDVLRAAGTRIEASRFGDGSATFFVPVAPFRASELGWHCGGGRSNDERNAARENPHSVTSPVVAVNAERTV